MLNGQVTQAFRVSGYNPCLQKSHISGWLEHWRQLALSAQGMQASVVWSMVCPWYSRQSNGLLVQILCQKNLPEAHIVQSVLSGPVHQAQDESQGMQVSVPVLQKLPNWHDGGLWISGTFE
jgi:hypothetical protein